MEMGVRTLVQARRSPVRAGERKRARRGAALELGRQTSKEDVRLQGEGRPHRAR